MAMTFLVAVEDLRGMKLCPFIGMQECKGVDCGLYDVSKYQCSIQTIAENVS